MKKVVLFSFMALTASVFADVEVANVSDQGMVAANECKPKSRPCKPKPKPKSKCEPCVIPCVNPVVLTTARPCADNGFYFFADILYWYTDVGNTDWSSVLTPTTTPPTSSYRGEHLQWQWNWGFRVGFGVDLDHDQWDTNLYYTWFQGKSSSDSNGASVYVTAPETTAYDNVGGFGDFTEGNANGRLNYNVVDWELGRWFYISRSISIRPHAGLRSAWMSLKQREYLTVGADDSPVTMLDKTGLWALGPTAGLNTNWWFGDANNHHFGIFGDFGGGLLFGQMKNKFVESYIDDAVATAGNVTARTVNTAIPVLNALMGLSWDTCFSCNKYHFGVRLGYELQYWFRLSQRLVRYDSPSYLRLVDNLSLQGLTIDFRFDF